MLKLHDLSTHCVVITVTSHDEQKALPRWREGVLYATVLAAVALLLGLAMLKPFGSTLRLANQDSMTVEVAMTPSPVPEPAPAAEPRPKG